MRCRFQKYHVGMHCIIHFEFQDYTCIREYLTKIAPVLSNLVLFPIHELSRYNSPLLSPIIRPCDCSFFIMTQISDMVKGVVEGEEVCITLGGDHSIALGKSCDDNVM